MAGSVRASPRAPSWETVARPVRSAAGSPSHSAAGPGSPRPASTPMPAAVRAHSARQSAASIGCPSCRPSKRRCRPSQSAGAIASITSQPVASDQVRHAPRLAAHIASRRARRQAAAATCRIALSARGAAVHSAGIAAAKSSRPLGMRRASQALSRHDVLSDRANAVVQRPVRRHVPTAAR